MNSIQEPRLLTEAEIDQVAGGGVVNTAINNGTSSSIYDVVTGGVGVGVGSINGSGPFGMFFM
jgi:hypothetical protein